VDNRREENRKSLGEWRTEFVGDEAAAEQRKKHWLKTLELMVVFLSPFFFCVILSKPVGEQLSRNVGAEEQETPRVGTPIVSYRRVPRKYLGC